MTTPRQHTLPPGLAAEAEAKWVRLTEALGQAGVRLPDDPGLPDRIRRALAFSDFVAESCTRHPELLEDLCRSGDLDRAAAPGYYAAGLAPRLEKATDTETLCRRLRRFRCREMIRIAIRDLAGLSDLTETTTDLSALAEACLELALGWLHARLCADHGQPLCAAGHPQGLVVLGLGKLGAGELNFSSDVDLIFAFPGPGETHGEGPAISSEEFFTRLCRQLVHVIGHPTPDGFVFRVDLRLRPYGENGPLVMSFDAMEQYYQEQGRDWERYAWIKARVVAGARKAGETLLERLSPFVYRRYLDFGAFESLRSMKQMITREIARRGMARDIKLGAGGIREIEFFGQIFQLIRGGVTPALRERGIRKVLAALAAGGHISAETRSELDAAYVFLRHVEHRLQEFSDRQTHALPEGALGLARLAAAVGYPGAEEFSAALKRHRARVHGHFQALLEPSEGERRKNPLERRVGDVWLQLTNAGQAAATLREIGFDTAEEALQLLEYLRTDSETRALSPTGRQRLDRLIPMVLLETAGATRPVAALRRIIDLIRSVERRTSYLALLLEYPAAIRHLVKLADASPWIASYLAQHPVLLDELLDARTLYQPPGREVLTSELTRRLDTAAGDDLEMQIEALCIFRQVNVLRVAAADVSGNLPLMRVSDVLSEIAETTLDAVVDLAWAHLVARHGTPDARLNGTPCGRGFAVIAYGKLGGLELGYGSDLDLVFLHAGVEGQTVGGPRPIDNAQFFNRLGQRVIHILTSHTRAGRVYEIDTRLRPSGVSGILVRHVEAFADYQQQEAWTWEHQALIKARPVSGDRLIRERFEAIRAQTLTRPRASDSLHADVRDMRRRMRREHSRPEPGVFDLKQDPGGIVDIEFLVQYLVLRHAHRHPQLARWTDNVRLIQTLIGTQVLDEYTAHVLKHAYLIYRAAAHQLSLQEMPAKVPAGKFEGLPPRIRRIWGGVFRKP
jgi:glutamate-ammonia-ligase adenylyltransferase